MKQLRKLLVDWSLSIEITSDLIHRASTYEIYKMDINYKELNENIKK